MRKKSSGEDFREGDLDEEIERRAVLLHLRPHHGAFPGVDDELRQRPGAQAAGDGAVLLRLGDGLGNGIAPPGKALADLPTDELALAGQLSPEISQQAALGESARDDVLVEALEML